MGLPELTIGEPSRKRLNCEPAIHRPRARASRPRRRAPPVPSPPNAPPSSASASREPFIASALGGEGPADLPERMQAWVDGVAARLRELGCDAAAAGVELGTSRVGRVVLARGPDRAGGGRGSVVLTMASDLVEVGLELAAADLSALKARVVDPVRGLEIATALQALPEQFT